MNLIADMSLRVKTFLLIILGLVFIVILSVTSYIASGKFEDIIEKTGRNADILSSMRDITESFQRTRINVRVLTTVQTQDDLGSVISKVEELQKETQKEITELDSITKIPEFVQMINNLKKANLEYNQMFQDAVNLKKQYASEEEITAFFDKVGVVKAREVQSIIKQMSDFQTDISHENKVLADSLQQSVITTLITVTLISIIVLLSLGTLIVNILSNSINKLQSGLVSFFAFLNRESSKAEFIDIKSKDEFGNMSIQINASIEKVQKEVIADNALIEDAKVVMSRVKNGWFSQYIEGSTTNASLEEFKNNVNDMIKSTRSRFVEVEETLESYAKHNYHPKLALSANDERDGVFEKLVLALNSLQTSITQMLVDNKSNGLTLNDSSNVLLANVDKLNQSSNEAAASLEETAAALEEMTSTIVSNTENVVKMANFANEVSRSANDGMALAKETNISMDEINTQVNLINEAIAVIDQIAFQTNILSLNAAVEAATAGEAGRGFAVVAGEVRNLAARSAEAAKEIKHIVELATSKANEGKNIADKMIQGYVGLNDNISKTIEIIGDIESASKEQQSGIEQINDAVTQLDQQTQQNAMIASQTHDIATLTDNIAKVIVDDANMKEFEGKDKVKAQSNKQNNNNKKHLEIRSNSATSVKSSNKVIENKSSTKQIKAVIPENSDDEWESF
ncbi:MAG: methyl-accepting chemotaxis protein [Arcobacteraceae bacterium]|jgi:methyl-accepting chemotaxis protein|nr:methyl-accepting chemotaxis protein [Arcobacteraceae bacterium]MDY0364351.1 methyl-accepting chemotaxis protein [Arcobacteraceae bacterium]